MNDSKVVLSTGCSSGIGRDLCGRLSSAGYAVVATARQLGSLEGVEAALKLELDVTSDQSISEAIAAAMRSFGRVDALVNNAGFAIAGTIEELPDEALRSMFEVNFFGVMRMLRAVVPHMREQRSGIIVNIGSIAGRFSLPTNGCYSATKFALEAISDAARRELGPLGIRVVLVEPGGIRTNFLGSLRAQSESWCKNQASPYRTLYARSDALSDAMMADAPGPEAVSRVVLQALGARKPRARYFAAVPLGARLMLHASDSLADRVFGLALERTPLRDGTAAAGAEGEARGRDQSMPAV
jgi:NADP-dependent 3-hydroxy acid dehydrogenase YdfG